MMLLDRGKGGDAEAARELLSQAAEAYAGIGMPRHLALVEGMLDHAGSGGEERS